jgi:diacylglycerol kinase
MLPGTPSLAWRRFPSLLVEGGAQGFSPKTPYPSLRQSRNIDVMTSSSATIIAWVTGRARSFGFAFRGLRILLREPNARIHALATFVVVTLGWALQLNASEWCLVTLAIFSVLAAEGFNTALEHLANAVSREKHPLIGAAKDVSASAVLLAAVGASVVGAIVFGPKLLTIVP